MPRLALLAPQLLLVVGIAADAVFAQPRPVIPPSDTRFAPVNSPGEAGPPLARLYRLRDSVQAVRCAQPSDDEAALLGWYLLPESILAYYSSINSETETGEPGCRHYCYHRVIVPHPGHLAYRELDAAGGMTLDTTATLHSFTPRDSIRPLVITTAGDGARLMKFDPPRRREAPRDGSHRSEQAGARYGSLLPIRLGDYVLWYEPREDVLALLPGRIRRAVRLELERGSSGSVVGGQCYLDACRAESGAIVRFTLLPNPSTDNLTHARFLLLAERTISATLHDLTGRYRRELLPPRRLEAGEQALTFELDGVPFGVHLLVLTTEAGEQVVARIVVE